MWPLMIVFALLSLGSTMTRAVGQDRPIVLKGSVVLPTSVMKDAYVVLQEGKISRIEVTDPKVAKARVIDTRGFIYPGLVDLHNHPSYAAFTRWFPTEQFPNRYKWRRTPPYVATVQAPARMLQADSRYLCELITWGEIQAAMGGTTAIQGLSPQKDIEPRLPDCVKRLIRNLDWFSGLRGDMVGREKLTAYIDVQPLVDSPSLAQDLKAKISSGEVTTFIIHLGEGKASDPQSVAEFDALERLGLLTNKTAIIHGTAFGTDHFKKMAAAGTALIWSPHSNLALYGTTTDVKAAAQQGVTIALSPDWNITGGANLLEELRFARSVVPTNLFDDRQLFLMATLIPAKIAGFEGVLGELKAGAVADILVLAKVSDSADAYAAITHATPADVQLVLVSGQPVFGNDSLTSYAAAASNQSFTVDTIKLCNGERKALLQPNTAGSRRLPEIRKSLSLALRAFDVPLQTLEECR